LGRERGGCTCLCLSVHVRACMPTSAQAHAAQGVPCSTSMHHDASVSLVVEVGGARDVVQRRGPVGAVVIQLAGVGHEPHVHVVVLRDSKCANDVLALVEHSGCGGAGPGAAFCSVHDTPFALCMTHLSLQHTFSLEHDTFRAAAHTGAPQKPQRTHCP